MFPVSCLAAVADTSGRLATACQTCQSAMPTQRVMHCQYATSFPPRIVRCPRTPSLRLTGQCLRAQLVHAMLALSHLHRRNRCGSTSVSTSGAANQPLHSGHPVGGAVVTHQGDLDARAAVFGKHPPSFTDRESSARPMAHQAWRRTRVVVAHRSRGHVQASVVTRSSTSVQQWALPAWLVTECFS